MRINLQTLCAALDAESKASDDLVTAYTTVGSLEKQQDGFRILSDTHRQLSGIQYKFASDVRERNEKEVCVALKMVSGALE